MRTARSVDGARSDAKRDPEQSPSKQPQGGRDRHGRGRQVPADHIEGTQIGEGQKSQFTGPERRIHDPDPQAVLPVTRLRAIAKDSPL